MQRPTTTKTGASAVEYGLLVAGIAALIVLIVFAFGGVDQGHACSRPRATPSPTKPHRHQLLNACWVSPAARARRPPDRCQVQSRTTRSRPRSPMARARTRSVSSSPSLSATCPHVVRSARRTRSRRRAPSPAHHPSHRSPPAAHRPPPPGPRSRTPPAPGRRAASGTASRTRPRRRCGPASPTTAPSP